VAPAAPAAPTFPATLMFQLAMVPLPPVVSMLMTSVVPEYEVTTPSM
jgi:hypothetical protein